VTAVRRQFTRQGHIEALHEEMTLAEAFYGFLQQQRESGADDATIARMEAAFREAAASITAGFERLFSGATAVQIDDQTYRLDGPPRMLLTGEVQRLVGTNDYRAAEHGTVWHWCPGCRFWPADDSNFREPEGQVGPATLCAFCTKLDQTGGCTEHTP
jgi:hypothetical protein